MFSLLCSQTPEKLHFLVIMENIFRPAVTSVTSRLQCWLAALFNTRTDLRSDFKNNWCRFLYWCSKVFKALCNGSVCQKYFKNTSDLPSASISSCRCLMTASRLTGNELLWHRTCFTQHPIINLCEHQHTAGQQGQQSISQPHPVPFVHRSHGLGPNHSASYL